MNDCDEETPNSIDAEGTYSKWNLDTIPREIFLHICSFLSMRFLIDVMSKVCRRFEGFIEDDSTWMIRLFARFPSRYPIIKSEEFCWKEACAIREEQHWLWHNNGSNMSMFHIQAAHFASVDAIHIIEDGRFCVSGSRDHCLKLWSLTQVGNAPISDMPEAHNEKAHTGWIWCLAHNERNHILYSGSWDSKVKSWDINQFSASLATYGLGSAVLCLGVNNNVFACGCYDRTINCFDDRSGNHPIFSQVFHRKPVLCLYIDEHHIISGSEDHTLAVFDRIAGKVRDTIEFEGCYSMSLSYQHNHLWIGDNRGSLHLIDPTHQQFKVVKNYPSGHMGQITGVHFSLGSLITCSMDKSIKVLEPNDNPQCIASMSFTSEISGISAYKNILASSHSDDSISVWLPSNLEN